MSDTITMRQERIEQLQRLCDGGQCAKLQATITTYSTKELRTLCGGFGVSAQSKEYEAYQSKAGYTELLVKLLEANRASNAEATDGSGHVPITGNRSGRTRRTKNCNLRLTNVLFSAAMAPYLADWIDARARKKRAAEGSSPFWEKVRAEFLSTKKEYAGILCSNDLVFVSYNLGSPVAHSSEKLQQMWEMLGLAYASVFSHAGITRNDSTDLSACAGRHDVYYLRRRLNDKPELLPIVCPIPVDTNDTTQKFVEIAPRSVPQNAAQRVQILNPSVQQIGQQSLQLSVRQSSLTHTASPAMEPVANVPSKDHEGEQLMTSIKLAYDVLAVMPAADRGSEIEHTIRRRLHRCAKRLKTLEDEVDRHSMGL